jgi:hypothetical protein
MKLFVKNLPYFPVRIQKEGGGVVVIDLPGETECLTL